MNNDLYYGKDHFGKIQRKPTKKRRGKRYFSHAEIDEIFATLKARGLIREHRQAIIALYTGFRPRSEVMGLCPMSIDLDANLITAGILTDYTKGGGGPRTVPLLPPVKAVIQEMMAERVYAPMEPFFATWNPQRWQELFAPYNVGIERCRMDLWSRAYCFRHTYASWLLQKGAELKEIQELLGHSTLAITAETYGHIKVDAAHKAAYLMMDITNDDPTLKNLVTPAHPHLKIVGS